MTPTVSFADAVSVVKQIRTTLVPGKPVTTMLGKRVREGHDHMDSKKSRIEYMKVRKRCSACGKKGHWYRDISDCAKIVRDKRQ